MKRKNFLTQVEAPWRRANLNYRRHVEVVRLYREGKLKVKEICERLDIDRGALYKILSRYTSYRRTASANMAKGWCGWCGEPFWKPAHRDARYCSKSCAVRDRRRYSDFDLLVLLAEKADRLQRDATAREVDSDPEMPSQNTYRSRFGSFGRAQVLARDILKMEVVKCA